MATRGYRSSLSSLSLLFLLLATALLLVGASSSSSFEGADAAVSDAMPLDGAAAAAEGISHRKLLIRKNVADAITKARAAAEAALARVKSQLDNIRARLQSAGGLGKTILAALALPQVQALRAQAKALADAGLKVLNALAGQATLRRPEVQQALTAARAALDAAKNAALDAAKALQDAANSALNG